MNLKFILGFTCFFFLVSSPAFCQVRLPRLIGDGMVLQRDTNIKLWGWAAANEDVTIDFLGKTYSAKADGNSKWVVTLPKQKAGGPYTLTIKASNQIELKNILIGDVWVCSGQSNMVIPMERVKERYKEAIAQAGNAFIRHFVLSTRYDFNAPQEDAQSGVWEPINQETILRFSAIGYFFAKDLYEKYRIPIGLISASVGGSPVEAWLSYDALKEFPNYLQSANKFRDNKYIDSIRNADNTRSAEWYNLIQRNDIGMHDSLKWSDIGYDASEWKTMPLPGFWKDQGLPPVNGAVWFRKEIDLPQSMVGKPAKLMLGRIVDRDSVYINGKFVGAISYQYPPRRYDVSPTLLKAGKNIIVVRVINNSGAGGFIKDKPYQLLADGQTIDLRGNWQYKLGTTADELLPPTFFQYKPVGLFNGMIAPLINFQIKGVIWYQGESNAGSPNDYQSLFTALISDWRQQWKLGNFPFLYVQLANFMERTDQPSESNWAELREAQRKTMIVPETGMAVAIDIGEWNDIHPLNKEDVGKRLARLAQKIAYGDKKIVDSGPAYKSFKIEGNKIIITFTSTGGGLISKGSNELKYFSIAGPDKKFVWAKAQIKGDKVVVWNEKISNPAAARYAWADNPEGANLYNVEGLPASPFKTD